MITLDVDRMLEECRRRLAEVLRSKKVSQAIGAAGPAEALGRLGEVRLECCDLGWLMYIVDSNDRLIGVHRKSAPMAICLDKWKRICLNDRVAWQDPSATLCVDQDLREIEVDLLRSAASQVGARAVTAEQFMDLTVLHELAHTFGMQHGQSVAGVDVRIWRSFSGSEVYEAQREAVHAG